MSEIRRIKDMEEKMNRSVAALLKLGDALQEYDAVRPLLKELGEYYDSPQWVMDFEADADGELPEGLNRGVLSEDGLYNLLEAEKELLADMERLSKNAKE